MEVGVRVGVGVSVGVSVSVSLGEVVKREGEGAWVAPRLRGVDVMRF